MTPNSSLIDIASNSEWMQITKDFPIGFAVYVEAEFADYSGSLLSLNDGELRIALESFGGPSSALQILTVTLPGQIPLRAAIPSARGQFQSIGVSVERKLLSVVVDCSIVSSVWLSSMPQSLNISLVESLDPPTLVSIW